MESYQTTKGFLSASQLLRAVAHPDRLRIIAILKQRPFVCVGELQKQLGITQSMTSQHLAALRKSGIVTMKREANVNFYRLHNRKILNLLNCVKKCCCLEFKGQNT
jgi:ArsR family transcriptional regulator, virulence genes transcriptional regulator